jgi:hypothetical protein
VLQKFEATSNDLYYISLEALKNACDETYNALIGYNEQKYNSTTKKIAEDGSRAHLMSQILPKKADLDAFAQSKSIAKTDLKLIVKAKWYLFAYVYHSYHTIKNLKNECKNGNIPQCRSCKVGNTQDCLYNMKQTNYREEILYDNIQKYIDQTECSDIISAIQTLN